MNKWIRAEWIIIGVVILLLIILDLIWFHTASKKIARIAEKLKKLIQSILSFS